MALVNCIHKEISIRATLSMEKNKDMELSNSKVKISMKVNIMKENFMEKESINGKINQNIKDNSKKE
jgi:hypothetical protein